MAENKWATGVISPTKWSEKALLICKISGRGPPCIYPENSNGWWGNDSFRFEMVSFLWTTSLFSGGLHRLKKVTLTSWWSQPTHLRNIILGQMGSSPHKIGVTISRNETKTFFPRLEICNHHTVFIDDFCQSVYSLQAYESNECNGPFSEIRTFGVEIWGRSCISSG